MSPFANNLTFNWTSKVSSKKSRRACAIMFTDMVGYTKVADRDETQALELISKNRDLHNRTISAYGGKLIKEMGDGMLASFDCAAEAVNCALSIQKKANYISNLRLRVGIHFGPVVVTNNDVFGKTVIVASRIQEMAQAQQILVSSSVEDVIKEKGNFQATSLGLHTLKHLKAPVRVYNIKNLKETLERS